MMPKVRVLAAVALLLGLALAPRAGAQQRPPQTPTADAVHTWAGTELVYIRDSNGRTSNLYRLSLTHGRDIYLTDVRSYPESHTSFVGGAACATADDSIYYTSSAVHRIDGLGGEPTQLTPHMGPLGITLAENTQTLLFSGNFTVGNVNYRDVLVVYDQGGLRPWNVRGGARQLDPDFRPDGVRFVYNAESFSDGYLQIAHIDGTILSTLTPLQPGVRDAQPQWSPDGTRIAFASYRNETRDIYTIRADGSDLVQLTSQQGNNWYPIWSPDGQWLAFSSDRQAAHRHYQMYVMDVQGGNVQRIQPPMSPAAVEGVQTYPVCWLTSNLLAPVPTPTPATP